MTFGWFVIAAALLSTAFAMLVAPAPSFLPANSWFTMGILMVIFALLVACVGVVSLLEQRAKALRD